VETTSIQRSLIPSQWSLPGRSLRLPLRTWLAALLALGASLGAVAAASFYDGERTAQALRLHDERRASELSAVVARAFSVPLELVRGLRDVVDTFPALTEAEFFGYAERLAREHRAVVAIHLRPLILADERGRFEQQQGYRIREPFVDGQYRLAGRRPRYLPVVRRAEWEPARALGADLLAGDAGAIAEAALESDDTFSYVATDVPAAATPGNGAHLLCLLRSLKPDSSAGGAGTARGLIEVCLTFEAFLREALKGLDAVGLDITVFDLSAPAGHHVAYSQRSSEAASTHEEAWRNQPQLGGRSDIHVANRLWRVLVRRRADLAPASRSYPVWTAGAAGGLLLAGLVLTLGLLRQAKSRLGAARKLGQYVLEEEIGRGAMGRVYRASHSLLRRPTALKVMPVMERTAQTLANFEQEVRLTASLSHPNTVAVYDFGRTTDGSVYYAMEYLEGLDLQRLVELHGPLPPARVIHLLAQACGALAEAHEQGLIHRDIKPANLMLCVRGGIPDFLKVMDFGLVKDLHDPTELERSDFVGTPLYAAPEAVLAPHALDGRADLYSLGAVAFFLLTGREVFRGRRVMDVLAQHASAAIPSLAEAGLPAPCPELEQLIRHCLAKGKDARPRSADALRRALERLASLHPWSEREARTFWVAHQSTPSDALRRRPSAEADDFALGATMHLPSTLRRA
jgi:serine/threonine protein kinase